MNIIVSNDLFKVVKGRFGYDLIQVIDGCDDTIDCFTTLEFVMIEYNKLSTKYRRSITNNLKNRIWKALEESKSESVVIDGTTYFEDDLFENDLLID